MSEQKHPLSRRPAHTLVVLSFWPFFPRYRLVVTPLSAVKNKTSKHLQCGITDLARKDRFHE